MESSEKTNATVKKPQKPRRTWLSGTHLAFWSAAFVLLGIGLSEKPMLSGDGFEYLFMTHAIRTTGSPAFSEEANQSLQEQILAHRLDFYDQTVHDRFTEGVKAKLPFVLGFIPSTEGVYYSYHFFLYCLPGVVFESILDSIGLNPLMASQMTNVFFVLTTLGYLYFLSSFKPDEKHWIASLFLLSGTTYYLLWPHPEVFTASLLLIAVLAWKDGRPVLAILAAAIASNQNPPAAILVPAIFVAYHVSLFRRKPIRSTRGAAQLFFSKTYFIHACCMVLAGSISLLSPLFYLHHYGVPNLIVEIGATQKDLIGLTRIFSLWFDLNLGVILGNLGTYLIALAAMVAAIVRGRKWMSMHGVWGWLAIASLVFLMSLPALGQGNWNAGASIFIRYGYWLFVPLIPPIVMMTGALAPNLRNLALAAGVAIQAFLVLYNQVYARDYSPAKLTMVSKNIMRTFPSLYNPVPEIFAERTIRIDGGFTKDQFYTIADSTATIRKILVHESFAPPTTPSLINSFKIHGSTFLPLQSYQKVHIEGWVYLNGRFARLEPFISQTFSNNSDRLDWSGWSNSEGDFRWSDGKEASISFPAYESKNANGVLTVIGTPYKTQRIRILLNGELLYDAELTEKTTIETFFNPDILREQSGNYLLFQFPQASTDPSLKMDSRALGFAIESIRFD